MLRRLAAAGIWTCAAFVLAAAALAGRSAGISGAARMLVAADGPPLSA